MSRNKNTTIAAFVFLCVVARPISASASDRNVALALAREGRCEVALTELAALRGPAARDAEVERMTGECALRLQRFKLAAEALERTRSIDPGAPRVDLHLAMATFHLGDLDAAEAALRRAERSDSETPEFLLYSGLLALERDDFGQAARRFDAASRLSDRAPEPMASFYLGRALSELDASDEAEIAFARVLEDYPGTSWAAEAERARDRMRASTEFQYWASAEVGFEHDDNVLLRGRGVGLPSEISGQSDQRGFWYADLGGMKDLGRGFGTGAVLRYAGSGHEELKDFDTHAPGATVWLDRALGDAGDALRLQYDFDAVWVDDDPFVTNHLVTGSFFKPWERFGRTTLAATYSHDYFSYDRFDVLDGTSGVAACPGGAAICGPPGLDEKRATNRTGDGAGARVVHHLPLPLDSMIGKNLWIEGGYGYSRYWAGGREYDHQRHQVELEAGAELPWRVSLRVGGRFAYVAYDNPTVFPDPSQIVPGQQYPLRSRDRRERETGVWVLLERPLTDSMVLAASFRRTRNRSNAEVFDYDRNVYGLSLRMSFGG